MTPGGDEGEDSEFGVYTKRAEGRWEFGEVKFVV